MKKFFLSAIVLLAATSMFAQPQEKKEDLKVGKNSFELLFTPFQSDGTMFKLNDDFGIRYRHFWGNNVLRVSLNAGFSSDTDGKKVTTTETGQQSWGVGYKDNYSTTHSHSFGIALGYERHFNINRRLGLYVGGELGYRVVTGREYVWKDELYTNNNTTYKNTADYTDYNAPTNAFAASVFTGIDFHVYKGLYLGAEFGLKYQYAHTAGFGYTEGTEFSSTSSTGNSYSQTITYKTNETTTVTINNSSTTTTTVKDPERVNNSAEQSFKFYVIPALRIGWRF